MLKIISLTAVLLMLISVPAVGGIKENWDSWSREDSCWQTASTVLMAFDSYQTVISIQKGSCEIGFASLFIGKYPTTEQIIHYGISTMIINYCAARMSPPGLRRLLQVTTIGVEYDVISKSYGTKVIFHIPIER